MEHSSTFAHSTFDGVGGVGTSLPADRLLLRMLDEMEYGMLLLDARGRLLYSNALGRDELFDAGPLTLRDGCVTCVDPSHRLALGKALDNAVMGRRNLLTIAGATKTTSIAVTPLMDDEERTALNAAHALLVFGKRPDQTGLAVDFYARAHGLTSAESTVLAHLARGLDPSSIALRQCVAISTIRSQIASLRAKTQAGSTRELLDRIAMLPPIRTALRIATHRRMISTT